MIDYDYDYDYHYDCHYDYYYDYDYDLWFMIYDWLMINDNKYSSYLVYLADRSQNSNFKIKHVNADTPFKRFWKWFRFVRYTLFFLISIRVIDVLNCIFSKV